MIDLVKTHLTHPWGPPWTLETLGGPWRPLATCLKMTILGEIKNENLSLNAILLSITLKIFLWAPLTQWHGWLRERSSNQKKFFLGHPNIDI